MNKLKNSIENHVLNESDMLARIQLGNLHAEDRRKMFLRRKMYLSTGAAAAMLVLMLAVWNFMTPPTAPPVASSSSGSVSESLAAATKSAATQVATNMTTGTAASQSQAYAMISIDINPSFELYANKVGVVVAIMAKNKDAESMPVQNLVGIPLEDATTGIIAMATEKGFINSRDAIDDYVIASTVILDERDPSAQQDLDTFGNKIRDAIAAADLSTTTKVAVIKATLQEKHQADKNGVPLGLSIINGMIKNESGTIVSVSEFAKEQDNIKQLAKRATITEAKSGRRETTPSKQPTRGAAETATIPTSPAATAPGKNGAN